MTPAAGGRSDTPVRHVVLLCGDQLGLDSSALRDIDPRRDVVAMFELDAEARHPRQHQQRLVAFLAAMRHQRRALRASGLRVHYRSLEQPGGDDFGSAVGECIHRLRPAGLVLMRPGDLGVLQAVQRACAEAGTPLELREDGHFLTTPQWFSAYARDRRELRLEHVYRQLRRHTGLLMDGGRPLGGRWNFDPSNRRSFGARGPGLVPPPARFEPDAITRSVVRLVERRFADHPGQARAFRGPVTPGHARTALADFIEHRLADFGTYQDAMALGAPHLYHSLLSTAMNLHLLDPREALDAAVEAHAQGRAPLNAVEGFVRQVLGWREYVHGIYWDRMPGYAALNALDARAAVPDVLWHGQTDMVCVRDCMEQLLEHAYLHHIQRLMVLGLFCLLLGVHPYAVHEWHMAMYSDAVDWVSLPNVLGMSQFGDGGVVGSKPYCASGAYINRMSDYCRHCRYDPGQASGETACPFTTLYWDFLARHRQRFQGNPRMGFQLRNLARRPDAELRSIRQQAGRLRELFAPDVYPPRPTARG